MLLEKELEHATSVDASDLAAKKDFIALKAEVDNLDINNLVSVPTSLNNLKAKANTLDVRKLKTVSVALKNISDVVDKQVAQNTELNTPKKKVNKLDRKTPYAITLIHINQHNTEEKKTEEKDSFFLEKKTEDIDKK